MVRISSFLHESLESETHIQQWLSYEKSSHLITTNYDVSPGRKDFGWLDINQTIVFKKIMKEADHIVRG